MGRTLGRIGIAVLTGLVVVAFVALAWRWQTRFRDPPLRPEGPPPSLALSERSDEPVASQPEALGLAGLLPDLQADPGGLDSVARMAGMEVLDADPEGLPVPDGARRLLALAQNLPDGRMEQGRYLVTRPPDVLESFYSSRLAEQGWTAQPARRWTLRGRQLTIRLADDGHGGTLVTAVLFRPNVRTD